MRPPAAAGGGLVVAAMVVGAWLRWRAAAHGYAPDELANLTERGVAAILVDPENGVNPPLLRLLFNPFLECTPTMQVGRAFSGVCGVLAIGAVARLAARLSGGGWAPPAAAAWMMALHLDAVRMGAQLRAYSPFMLVEALHLLAVERWARQPDRWWPVVITAALLPQLHFFGVPLLLGTAAAAAAQARSIQGLWRLYVPAAIGVLPWVAVALVHHEARVGMPGSLRDTLALMLSLDLQQVGVVKELGEVVDLPADQLAHVGQAALTVLLAVGAWFLLDSVGAAVAWGAAIGVLVGVVGFAQIQYVRSPVALFLLVPMCALFGATARRAWVLLPLIAVFGPPLQRGLADLSRAPPEDALPAYVARRANYEAARRGRDVLVTPPHVLGGLHLLLTGHHLTGGFTRGVGACEGDERCFTHEGVRYRLLDAKPDGLVVAVEEVPVGLGACAPVDLSAHLWVLDCRDQR